MVLFLPLCLFDAHLHSWCFLMFSLMAANGSDILVVGEFYDQVWVIEFSFMTFTNSEKYFSVSSLLDF